MAIKRRWTPQTIPLTNNLPAWKAICEDIHLNLILAGWEQTDDTGQLDFADVTQLPLDRTFAGYRMYLLADPLKDVFPIYMRLDFGCGFEGLGTAQASGRPRTLRIKSAFGVSTDLAGQLLGGSFSTEHPQIAYHTGANNTAQSNTPGISYMYSNQVQGFYGFIYGAGSRYSPDSNGLYYGASLAFFIQRDLDPVGNAQGSGFSVLLPNLNTINSNYNWLNSINLPPAVMYRFSASGITSTTENAQRVGISKVSQSFGGEVAFQPVFITQPQLRRCPSLLTYFHSDVGEGTIVSLPVAQGQSAPFICLGNKFGMPVDPSHGQWASWAMLFDGDEVSP